MTDSPTPSGEPSIPGDCVALQPDLIAIREDGSTGRPPGAVLQ